MDTLYIYASQDSNAVYWGRYQKVPNHPNVISRVFRRKTVEWGRYYISGPYIFQINPSIFPFLHVRVWYRGKSVFDHHMGRTLWIFYNDEDRSYYDTIKPNAFDNWKRQFKNRLREYGNSHFVPIDKGRRNIV